MNNILKRGAKYSALVLLFSLFTMTVYAATWTTQKSFMPGNGDVETSSLKTSSSSYRGVVNGVRHVQGVGKVRVSSKYKNWFGLWRSVNGSSVVTVSSLNYNYNVYFGVNPGTYVKVKWALENNAYLLANLTAVY